MWIHTGTSLIQLYAIAIDVRNGKLKEHKAAHLLFITDLFMRSSCNKSYVCESDIDIEQMFCRLEVPIFCVTILYIHIVYNQRKEI